MSIFNKSGLNRKSLLECTKMTSAEYREPSWACCPSLNGSSKCEWTIVEIKGGVEMQKHALDVPCAVFGRASDMVQVTTAHESCSRQHARIAFDKQGIPWLRDLGSTHGTTLNKLNLPKQAVGKLETNSLQKGSRGVVLYPGDVIQFGASTRMYCLEGPPQYERGAIRRTMSSSNANLSTTAQSSPVSLPLDAATAAEKTLHESNEHPRSMDGASWGMDMDIHVDDALEGKGVFAGDDTPSLKPLDPTEIPERHQKAFEKIMAKKYKLANLKTESERIRRKGSTDELTEGQNQQLQKNLVRETNLQQELEDMEQELRHKINPSASVGPSPSAAARRSKGAPRGEDDDVDDFYDRTVDHNLNKHNEQESEESLTTQWKELHATLKQYTIAADHSNEKIASIERRLVILKEDQDEDAFFVQNDLDLAKDVALKAESKKRSVMGDMDNAEHLLRVVGNGKLIFDRKAGSIGTVSSMCPPPPQHSSMMPPPTASMDMPPPFVKSAFPKDNQIDQTSRPESSMPPPKRKRDFESDLPTQTPSSPSTRMEESSSISQTHAGESWDMPPPFAVAKQTKGSRAPPIMGTLSVLNSAAQMDDTKKKKIIKMNKKEVITLSATEDSKKDVWKAPEGQDGSGITKLNAKFAGRY